MKYVSCSFLLLISKFGLDPHMTGYQQHFAIKGAGLVDYIPHSAGVDYSTARANDDDPDKAWRA